MCLSTIPIKKKGHDYSLHNTLISNIFLFSKKKKKVEGQSFKFN
jgi:hypothetical protein